MRSRDPNRYLRDIIDAATLVEHFTGSMTFEEFRSDPKTVAAVERKLQIISEAAIRLGNDAEKLGPGQPWAEIPGIGNWLRHRYERVDLDIIWEIATDNLPTLKTALDRALNADSSRPED